MQQHGASRSPRGTSPRDALSGALSRTSRWSPRSARRAAQGSKAKANKITPRQLGGGTASEDGAPSPQAPSQGNSGPASTAAMPLALESLREGLREDTQLIVDLLGVRMERLQRELVDSQARSLAESLAARPLEPARVRDDLGQGPATVPAAAFVRRPHQPPVPPITPGPLTDLDGDLDPEPRAKVGKEDVKVRRKVTNRVLQATEVKSVVMDVFATASDSMSTLHNFAQQDQAGMELPARLAHAARRRLHWWSSLERPASGRLLERIVDSTTFNAACVLMISLNAVLITFSTDYEMQHLGSSTDWMVYGEYVFICWYALELVMKIAAQGKYFFAGPDWTWNIFDFVLVAFSAVQLTVMTGAVNVAFIRSLRLFKISKIFRLFRFLEFLKDVKVMVYCMVHSLVAVFWALVLIVFLLYMFTIIIMQGVILSMEDFDETAADAADPSATFSSVTETMMILFQTTTGGRDWSEAFSALSGATWWAQLAYVFFIAFFTIAVWNIVTAIFIEKAMGLTEPDRHEVMMRERRTELRDAIELREILADVDSDGSNTLSTSEFEQVCQIPEFRHFLNSRGIHIKEAGTFFAMVAQSVGAGADIDIDTMIGCCLRIRGHATSIDLHTLRFEMRALLAEQRHALDELRLQMGLASQPPTPKLPKMISPVTRGQAPA